MGAHELPAPGGERLVQVPCRGGRMSGESGSDRSPFLRAVMAFECANDAAPPHRLRGCHPRRADNDYVVETAGVNVTV